MRWQIPWKEEFLFAFPPQRTPASQENQTSATKAETIPRYTG